MKQPNDTFETTSQPATSRNLWPQRSAGPGSLVTSGNAHHVAQALNQLPNHQATNREYNRSHNGSGLEIPRSHLKGLVSLVVNAVAFWDNQRAPPPSDPSTHLPAAHNGTCARLIQAIRVAGYGRLLGPPDLFELLDLAVPEVDHEVLGSVFGIGFGEEVIP